MDHRFRGLYDVTSNATSCAFGVSSYSAVCDFDTGCGAFSLDDTCSRDQNVRSYWTTDSEDFMTSHPVLRHVLSASAVFVRERGRQVSDCILFQCLFVCFVLYVLLLPLPLLLLLRPHGLTFTWWGCCQRHKPAELAHSFLFCSCVCFCVYSPFNCISLHKFSRPLSVFSLCSSGLISALLVLSTIYLSLYESFLQP